MTAPRPVSSLSASRPSRLGLVRALGIAAAAGLVLALTGAFGTVGAPLWLRLVYWVPVMLAGAIWGQVCSMLIERWVDIDERPWVGVIVLTLAISGPVSILVWFVTGFVFEGRAYPLSLLPLMVGPVVTVTATVSTINVFLSKAQPVQTHAAMSGSAAARFPDRLPMKLRGAEIRAVQAEDHYLRIHTDRGSDLILMRLSDALDELEGLEGAQTHRSWWVARGAVRDVARGDGRATLTLDGGLTAPVSRRYARALRETGWY
ncbi:MAG: LytTR family transcriptional regulator DNA-binding domain-containing protein [Alphaproteobacteria bacterium]|nr:LytTR family transcriptional regulator DNA-binding domain-containing protein [Alphaproteobacteria bacterium]MBU2378072.1 LytTR family transcriptional regulator DNA-binding domain-containing protein [Alphaproteobacteria bacterium]